MRNNHAVVGAAHTLCWVLVSGCGSFSADGLTDEEAHDPVASTEQTIIRGNLPATVDALADRVVLLPGCSGTLLTSQWVLTAAHCVGAKGPASFTVSTRTGASSQADWIQRHEQAPVCCGSPPASNAMDVAMVHLSTPLGAQSTNLSGNPPWAGQELTCYGYGNNSAFFDNAGNRSGNGFGTLRVAGLSIATVGLDRYGIVPNAASQIQWTGDSGGPCFDASGNIVGVQSNVAWNLQAPPSSALTVTSADQIRADRIRVWSNQQRFGFPNDFNRDGQPDILWHNAATGEAQVWNMNRSSRVGRATVDATRDGGGALVSLPWSIVGSNDFNRDGMTDILWHNAATGATQIWYMSGSSRIGRANVDAARDGGGALVSLPWSIVGSNDFNGDGSTDILWHNAATGATQIWYMSGSSRIGRANVDAARDGGGALVSLPWSIVGSNDVNHDGMVDIFWHNASTGHTQIWYMNGSSRIGRATVDAYSDGGGIPAVGAPWRITGTNDFNRDNSADILWHNATSGETQIWYMNGASRIGRATVDAYSDGGGIPLVGAPWAITRH